MKKSKILIVGGTGFIGRHLVARCLRETPFVTVLGLPEKSSEEIFQKCHELISVDIQSKEALQSALKGKHFEYVFNLGGYIDHTHYLKGGRSVIESHFIGLMNLIDCLDVGGIKGFVQVGSSDEYGDSKSPQIETMREKPISPYSFAKIAASHFIQMLSKIEGFPGVVVRFFLVYGPGQNDQRFLPQIIKSCLADESFKTSEGKQLRDFCYVEDAVEALIIAALSSKAKSNIINIASGKPVAVRQMVEKIIEITGGGKPLWGEHPYRAGENMELYADISLSKKLLGWKPKIDLDEGLKKTIDYYRNIEEGDK